MWPFALAAAAVRVLARWPAWPFAIGYVVAASALIAGYPSLRPLNEKVLKERCPDRFSSSELTSLAHVVDIFGGGTYQFIAFDSRGNFSRWTPENEKIRIHLPSKPFRQIERAETPPQEIQPARPMASRTADSMGLLMQQSIAAQERADRLMAVLFERLATPPPTPDPIMMLSGLAAVLEKIRPAQAGATISQLSSLASIVKQLKGSQPTEPSSPEDLALQPFLSMMTNTMMQKPAGARQPAAGPSPPPTPASPPPDLVWVLLPEYGPVLMRHDQAARAFARPAAPALPPPPPIAAPPSYAAPTASASNSAPLPWRSPPLRARRRRLPSRPRPGRPERGLPRARTIPVPAAAAPSSPAPVPTALATAPTHPAPATERCIVCNEPGRRELGHPCVLVCRYGHRSLIAPARVTPPPSALAAAGSPPHSLLPLDGGSITLSPGDLDAMLSDLEVVRALSPEIKAALEQVLAQIGRL